MIARRLSSALLTIPSEVQPRRIQAPAFPAPRLYLFAGARIDPATASEALLLKALNSPVGQMTVAASLAGPRSGTRKSAVLDLARRENWVKAGLRTAVAEGAKHPVSAYEKTLHALMVRALDGDAAAYQQFLLGLGGLFRAFFCRKLQVGDRAQAEDLVQEALLAVHLHRRTYDPSRPLGAWVYAIARYKLVDHLRRCPTTRIFVPVDAVEELFAADAPDAVDSSRDISALLALLPAKQSEAIRLVKLEELTAREAAARMGLSEADVKISIHRGLRKLMALVARDGNS